MSQVTPVEDEEKIETSLDEQRLEERRRLGEAAEELIAKIRSRPGLERFLLPPSFSSLVQALPKGFVVMLLTSNVSNHALILDGVTGSAKSVALSPIRDSFDKSIVSSLPRDVEIVDHHREDKMIEDSDGTFISEEASQERGLRADRRHTHTLEDTLADLWLCVVKPIIDALGLQKATGRDRPRVWWCATGELTFLPIHAAGVYNTIAERNSNVSSVECASDYIVSSYIPTLSALTRARKEWQPIPRSHIRGLLAHEATPGRGFSTLQSVRDEIDGVADCFMKAGATIVNDASVPPSVSSLLAKLQTARVNILHLACHGTQNKDPLRSAFILKDGELSVRELMRLDLRRAALAFLSASETAKGEQTQPDQAVHLAASMLFCGFKSIIGTMWSMDDTDGPDVARAVYTSLFEKEVLDLDGIPYALDGAVRGLQEKAVPAARWALFIHMGG